jgi:16S rRNA (adenine1518-N6/adenine1519-N6)-dimethyltransferase
MPHIPRKRFGQNFLTDDSIIEQIINAISPQPTDALVEIGPGMGALTQRLLPLVNQLDVIEIDRDLIPLLKKHCENLGCLCVHEADALKFPFASLIRANTKLKVVGNLPYNISTPLLFHLLKAIEHIQEMYFMLQEEVVDRLAATPGDKDYGRLSIMIQYHCHVQKLFTVPPTAFHPQPQVYSAIVQLIPRTVIEHPVKDLNMLSEVVRIAFQQRRKTLRNVLKTLISDSALVSLGINTQERPEQLDIDAYVKIANYLAK